MYCIRDNVMGFAAASQHHQVFAFWMLDHGSMDHHARAHGRIAVRLGVEHLLVHMLIL